MKKYCLLILIFLAGCSNGKLVALNEQYRDNKIEMSNNCLFLHNRFKYDKNNGIQYASDHYYYSNELKYTYTPITTSTDDAVFEHILKALEICQEENSLYSATYAEYRENILKMKKEKEERIKAEIIAKEENLKKQEEEKKRLITLSNKYGYKWCSGGITTKENMCLIEGEFKIFEQTDDGSLVEPYINLSYEEKAALALLVQFDAVAELSGMQMPQDYYDGRNELTQSLEEAQKLVFIVANPYDANQTDGTIVKGVFLRDGVYKYPTILGTKTVKKLKRLE